MMNILSTVRNLAFDQPIDREIYYMWDHLENGFASRDSLVFSADVKERLISGEEEMVERFREEYEALTLDDDFVTKNRVNLVMDSADLHDGIFLNIIGFENLLLALEQVERSDFYIIQPVCDVESTIEVYEEADGFTAYAYKGVLDKEGDVSKDVFTVGEEYVNVEDQEVKKQFHTVIASEFSAVLEKEFRRPDRSQLATSHDLVEKACRGVKRLNKYKGKRGKAIFTVSEGEVYLQRIRLEDTEQVRDEEGEKKGEKEGMGGVEESSQDNPDQDEEVVESDDSDEAADLSREEPEDERGEDTEDVSVSLSQEDDDYAEDEDVDHEGGEEEKEPDTDEGLLDDISTEEGMAEVSFEEESSDEESFGEEDDSFDDEKVEEEFVEDEVGEDETVDDEIVKDGVAEEDVVESERDADDEGDDFILSEDTQDVRDEIRKGVRKIYSDRKGYFPQDIPSAIEELDIEYKDILKRGLERELSSHEVGKIKDVLWDY